MKIFKRLLTVLLCIIISFSFFTTTSATDVPKITITNAEALPGETVKINISISDNPGIMAMAFCITYDSSVLVYKNYGKGYLSSYNVHNHADKGHVSFVNVETRDIATDGNIISLIFDVKSDAKPGKYAITLANSNREKHGTKLHNSFSTSKQEFVLLTATAGSVTVQETCENSGHKYGDWDILKQANCTDTGLKKHFCLRCDHKEEVIIPATHNFEADWTVDKEATSYEDGIMSRHCTNCDTVTDEITFKYNEITDDDNSSNASSDGTSSIVGSDTTASDSSDQNNDKPTIENIVGEKVPLEEVEKFEDYQQNIKPDPDNNDTQSENISDNNNSSEITSNTSEVTTGDIKDNNSNIEEKEPSYFATTSGIIMIVICSLLSIGIIALGILLIIRNKNSQ